MSRSLPSCRMEMKKLFMKKEKRQALTEFLKWWIPAVQNLKQKLLISIPLLKMTDANESIVTKKKKIIILGSGPNGSVRELNLIIAACTVCLR